MFGQANNNPILDTRTYLVQFDDGKFTELTANVIDAQMYAQCDSDGKMYVILDDLTDHRKPSKALSIEDQKTTDSRGRNMMRRSTAVWKICCQWKDGSISWEKKFDLKESHPAEIAEYAHQRGIAHEPAFNFWATHVLKNRDAIISLVKNRRPHYLKRTHKFGVELPKSVADAHAIDKKNGKSFWADSIAKEVKNVQVAFDVVPDSHHIPQNYQFFHCHIMFEVDMEDYRRKAIYVAGGHMPNAPPTITYTRVVVRETVQIALTLDALNGFEETPVKLKMLMLQHH